LDVLQIYAFQLPAVANATLASRVVYENSPHRFGGSGEEVSAVIPIGLLLTTGQLQPCFMDQGRSLQCLAWLFLGETSGSKTPEFVVNKREQSLGCLWSAGIDGGENAGDVAHGFIVSQYY
jgi:hypothetical protein